LKHFNSLEPEFGLNGPKGLSLYNVVFLYASRTSFRLEKALFPLPARLKFTHRRVERTAVSWEDGGLLFPS
jgi:hypothetical protein